MTEPEDFALESFQAKVIREVKNLQYLASLEASLNDLSRKRASLKSKGVWWLILFVLSKISEVYLARKIRNMKRRERPEQYVKKAEELLSQQNIKQHICPALQTIGNGTREIAGVITRALFPLVRARTILIPLDPMLFATSAVLISRMGAADFCASYRV